MYVVVYSLFSVVPIVLGLWFVVVFWCRFWFRNHLAEEERVGCFTLIVLWLSVFCVSSSRCLGLVCSL